MTLKQFNAVLDSYNASPQSVAAALDYVRKSAPRGRRVAVLGDMLELGEPSEAFHREVGRLARRRGFRRVAALGRFAGAVAEGFGDGAAVFPRGSWKRSAEWLHGQLSPGDWVLFKGSRGASVEKVFHHLREMASRN